MSIKKRLNDSAVQDVMAPMYDEFLDEFNRMIKDKDLAEANDQNAPSEYDVKDSYLDRELGVRRDDEGPHHGVRSDSPWITVR